MRLLFALLISLTLACGGDSGSGLDGGNEPDGSAGTSGEPDSGAEFASDTYGGMHRAEIEADCDKRVRCAERTNNFLREDAAEFCASTLAMTLNALPQSRLKFQLGIHRCVEPDVCDYVACADSPVVSFGETQIDKVSYACNQKVQCQIDSEMLAGDQQAIFDSCVLQSILVLDGFQPDERADYQESFLSCMPMTSCAFTACFPY